MSARLSSGSALDAAGAACRLGGWAAHECSYNAGRPDRSRGDLR
ncbi:MAG: hypothetical protein K0S98_3092, partial [Propionibacteriaceae bacterium]|nr:hypothetical protein [Propionibacteriaceae bacterium]